MRRITNLNEMHSHYKKRISSSFTSFTSFTVGSLQTKLLDHFNKLLCEQHGDAMIQVEPILHFPILIL